MQDITRREFGKAAVSVGGATALAACLERGDSVPQGNGNTPDRQHAWNEYLSTDEHGNNIMPRHHVMLLINYTGESTEDDRSEMERALSSLERAYEWSNQGLLFTVGYSPSYFRNVASGVPNKEVPPNPRSISPHQTPDFDTADVLIHLASDEPEVVLEAEEALTGDVDEPNGVYMEDDLNGVFEKVQRRTGFVGRGLPAENQDVDGIPDSSPIPEESPMFMGFKGRFERNQPSEDYVTITQGMFEEGTTQQLSKLDLLLERWYNPFTHSRYQRVAKMFCPSHADEGRVQGVGEDLGDSSGISACPVAHDSGSEKGVVGHAQKTSQAREGGTPPILRRDFNSTDGGKAGLHFNSLQESIKEFVRVREAMNGSKISKETPVGDISNNGILGYIRVQSRGNYLIPPRSMRSMPMEEL